MEAWIDIGRGPLFRLAFSLLLLGLLRVLALTATGMAESYARSRDKAVPWKDVGRQTLGWLFPLGRLWHKRPVYSVVSLAFHIGLIPVPIFLAAHVLLWKRATGLAWPTLPQTAADWLTILAIVGAVWLFCGRLFFFAGRVLSRKQDYLWPLLLGTPFVTGYCCANLALGAKAYQGVLLVHIYSADLIMMLIPFTKIAHCVLAPLSQAVTAMAWKFPAGAGARVAATLGHADRPAWASKARLDIDKEMYTG